MKKFIVKQSGIEGRGVFSNTHFNKGDVVDVVTGKLKIMKIRSKEGSHRYRDWVGVGPDTWVIPDRKIWRNLNHSCDPSVAIIDNREMIALKDIKIGDEITFDYSLTDDDPFQYMECRCGALNCRVEIRFIRSTPTDVFRSHFPLIPTYFQRIFFKSYIERQSSNDGVQLKVSPSYDQKNN